MAHKQFWQMSGIILALSLVFLGCPTDDSGEDDTWSAVTEVSQLDGTWKGSYKDSMALLEMMEGFGQEIPAEYASAVEGINATMSVAITTTIDIDGDSQKVSITTMTFSEMDDEVWSGLTSMAGRDEGVEVDDDRHSVTVTDTDSLDEEDFTEMVESGLQINQDGTKLKVPANEDQPEIIMTKQ